jgi:hypothetical protein
VRSYLRSIKEADMAQGEVGQGKGGEPLFTRGALEVLVARVVESARYKETRAGHVYQVAPALVALLVVDALVREGVVELENEAAPARDSFVPAGGFVVGQSFKDDGPTR